MRRISAYRAAGIDNTYARRLRRTGMAARMRRGTRELQRA